MAPTVVSSSIGVLGPLVVKLSSLLAGQYGRLKGVRKQILALNLELSTMHAAVQKYAMLEDPDIQVKQWISMVRELAYDIEDHIDKFIHRLGNGGRHGGFKESFSRIAHGLKTLGARRGIAGQIEELKARIKHVKELKNSYKLDDAYCSTSKHIAVDPRLSALFAEKAHLVGIDGPRDDLVKWMLEEGNSSPKQCRVLSIVGFGGLGKTTLANEVYRKIQGNFHCQAVVSVSQKPNIKKIIKDLIYKMPYPHEFTKDIDVWDEITCIGKLRELLQDKRYLILIDDIWSTTAWDVIKCALPESNCSSRIIVTTRIVDVARSCCSGGDDRMHKMESLSDLHSERLFFQRIFGSKESCPSMLKEVSNEILKKCGGLPLAIIGISGLLANRPAVKEEWEMVKRSIGSALENSPNLEGMNSILCLSYNDLPTNLKTCLLYLSTFPEDFEINRERLVLRWIAEGFIFEERGQSQYEVAERYFYELINRNLIQAVNINYNGIVHACRVHDMMLEILITKSIEDNFITIVGGAQTGLSNQHGVIRRLSVQYIDHELALALANEDLSHVRSLTVTESDCIKHLPKLAEFEALRVLDFEGCKSLGMYDMMNIDKLFQLKYLGLNGTDICKLPPRVVMLKDLEILDFRNTYVVELPAGFAQLTKLQYLLGSMVIKIPSGIGNMSTLRVISSIYVAKSPVDALEELGNLTRLNKLSIVLGYTGSQCGEPDVYRRHEEKLFSSLHKLIASYKLRSLCISNCENHLPEFIQSSPPLPSGLQEFSMYTDYHFMTITNWIAPALTSLVRLEISVTELTEDVLRTFGQLPALVTLFLKSKTGENRVIVQDIGFPSLKYFGISGHNGTYITFMKGAMPKIEYLNLELAVAVGRKYGFYLGIEYLPRLNLLVSFVNSNSVRISESKAAVDAIKEEIDSHTNHPKSRIHMIYNAVDTERSLNGDCYQLQEETEFGLLAVSESVSY